MIILNCTVCDHFQRVSNKDGKVDGGHDRGTDSCQRPRQCSQAQLLVNIKDKICNKILR